MYLKLKCNYVESWKLSGFAVSGPALDAPKTEQELSALHVFTFPLPSVQARRQ